MSHYMKASKKTFCKNVQDYLILPLLRQRQTGELCDVCLKLNGRSYHVHKAILALWSPYFFSMFTCDMLERTTRDIDLSESLVLENDDVFACLLDYMYTGNLVLSVDNIEDVVKTSDFLLMDDVKEYCRQFYLDLGNLDLANCLRVRFLAEDHNLPHVLTCAQKIIESRFHDFLVFHEEVLELPLECLLRLLQDPKVVQHTTHSQLAALMKRWIEYDRHNRLCHHAHLQDQLHSWISGYADQASYLGRELSTTDVMRLSMEGADFGLVDNANAEVVRTCPPSQSVRRDKGDAAAKSDLPSMNGSDCVAVDCQGNKSKPSTPSGSLSPSQQSQQSVLFSVVCNQGLKYMKILVYSLQQQRWLHFPASSEKILHFIPVRQTICSMVADGAKLYMYLCSSFPYPTDMLKINILMVDLISGQPTLFSFRTVDFYNPCYRTTLTNYRTAPPAMVYCAGQLYVIGNKEGTGHLFMCSLSSHQYTCYQIPGSRFISLARAVVKEDRNVYIWFRHRTGPSEEFCIKKSVGFAIFDTKTKIFNAWEIQPPEVTYEEFARPYVMCVRDETVMINHPGQPALVLDEVRCKWVTSLRRLPLPTTGFHNDDQAYGFELLVAGTDSMYILSNELPYTTALTEISDKLSSVVTHTPPPIDNISVVALGHLPAWTLAGLEYCEHYDEAYASALHVAMQYSDGDTSDSGASNCEDGDSDNDYEYDEDIYDYDYDLGVNYDF